MLVVLLLLLGASAGYLSSIGSKGKAGETTTSSAAAPTGSSTTTQSPCSQVPLRESGHHSASPNGTGFAELDHPVFALAPGSQGTFCVSYSNASNSSSSELPLSAHHWSNASNTSTGVSIVANPGNASIPPHSNATVVYTVSASNSSAGAYGLGLGDVCGNYQLIVTDNASRSSFEDFPGLLGNLTSAPGLDCFYWPPPGKLTGFSGLSMVYLRYTTEFSVPFHETSRSIQSVVESSTEQNITIKLGIQSYALPVTVQFLWSPGRDDFYMARWDSNPQLTQTPGDACDWKVGNSSLVNHNNQLSFPLQGVTVNAPTLHLQPYSNGTFTFSMRISNLTGGYAEGEGGLGSQNKYVTGGYYATLLSTYVTWDGGPSGSATLDLSWYFPVGQIGETASGSCPVPEGIWTNTPWYLDGISF